MNKEVSFLICSIQVCVSTMPKIKDISNSLREATSAPGWSNHFQVFNVLESLRLSRSQKNIQDSSQSSPGVDVPVHLHQDQKCKKNLRAASQTQWTSITKVKVHNSTIKRFTNLRLNKSQTPGTNQTSLFILHSTVLWETRSQHVSRNTWSSLWSTEVGGWWFGVVFSHNRMVISNTAANLHLNTGKWKTQDLPAVQIKSRPDKTENLKRTEATF